MIAMVIAVVLMLKSKASTATGEATARQASSFTVQITRLRSGRVMKPTSRASAATAMPGASAFPPKPARSSPLQLTGSKLYFSSTPPIAQHEMYPRPRQLGVLAILYRCYRVGSYDVQFLWYLYYPHLLAGMSLVTSLTYTNVASASPSATLLADARTFASRKTILS